MAISNTQRNNLNRSNRAAKEAKLGSWLQGAVISASATIGTAEKSASAVVLYDALATQSGMIFRVYTSTGSPKDIVGGSPVFKGVRSGGSLTISSYSNSATGGGSGSFTVSDIVCALIW